MEKWDDLKKEIKSISQEEILYIELMAEIFALKEELGLTQTQLAESSGLKQEAIARLIRFDDSKPNVMTLLKVLNAMDYKLTIEKK